MTERERWIVYPLLFLALGASLRDKFAKPASIEVARLQCEELRANRVVIVDPQQKQPRLKFGTVPETSPRPPGAAPNVCGQIEVLDSSQRVQTGIANGMVRCGAVTSGGVVVIDPLGRPRVEIGTKAESPADPKDQPPRTSGGVEILGSDNAFAVSLGSTAEGGYIAARHVDRLVAVIAGNAQQGSGVFLQVGAKSIPMIPPVTSAEIKQLGKAFAKEPAGKPGVQKPAQPPKQSQDGEKRTAPAVSGSAP